MEMRNKDTMWLGVHVGLNLACLRLFLSLCLLPVDGSMSFFSCLAGRLIITDRYNQDFYSGIEFRLFI